jgi:hypothetical protein
MHGMTTTWIVITHIFRDRFRKYISAQATNAWLPNGHLVRQVKSLKLHDEDYDDDGRIGQNQKIVFAREHLTRVFGFEHSLMKRIGSLASGPLLADCLTV